jgi:peptidoglycan DL-endopeptidase CwlO
VTHRSLLRRPSRRLASGKLRRASFVVMAALVGCLAVPLAEAAPSSLASKQAQVERVLGQIQALDVTLEQAVEAYNVANSRLVRIRSDLDLNTKRLAVAQANLRRSQKILSARLVALYTSGADDSTLGVLLGATSLDDFLSRVETVDTVSHQDTRIQREVVRFRTEVARRQIRLRRARAAAAHLVAQRAARKASIEQQLSERRQLVSSIRAEIERMKAAEARRQAELARQAQARALAQATAHVVAAPVAPAPAAAQPAAPAAAPAPAAPAAPSSGGSAAPLPPSRGGVVGIAMRYLGTPYRWGGASPRTGFDCSGFVMYVFAQVGVSLPHSSYAQYGMGMPVGRSQLQPGDLVFFAGLGHVGIYIGGNQFIHAPHTGDVVKISSMSGWYASTFAGGRRI